MRNDLPLQETNLSAQPHSARSPSTDAPGGGAPTVAPAHGASPQARSPEAPAASPSAVRPVNDARPGAPAPRGASARTGRARARRIGMTMVALAVVIAGIGYWAWWDRVGRFHVSTDNAYVQGNLVQLTPQVTGSVVAINADDTDLVRAGQPLVVLDSADAQVALEQAQAQLAQAVREVQQTYTTNGTLRANIALREADVARARADVARATDDVRRREGLLASGAVSGEEMHHARSALDAASSSLAAAQAAVKAAREQLASNLALTEGIPVEEHPNVQRAAARVREALLAVRRATLPAPVSGYVAKRSVQVGQRVQPGQPLLSVIPLDQVWVEANFKEVQLRDMRIGQPVQLTADVYGDRVTYRGRIVGLGAGTGSAFSVLPAQNATGNWIKVVQRLPVRIELDAAQLAEHPLRVGLSMEADVDIHDRSGPALASAPRRQPVAQTQALEADSREADEMVQRIIAANLARTDARASAAAADARASAAARDARTATAASRTARAPRANAVATGDAAR